VGQLKLICNICMFILWANASIFHGSTPAAGPCESLILQPYFLLDGPQILLCRKWAYARVLHKGFQAAVSQLKLIGNIHTFALWSNGSICPWQHQILLHRKWAPARILHKGFQAAVGQLELISNIHAFTPQANASIFPGSTPSAGPCESLIGQPIVCWMGQCKVIAWILWYKEWAHARILYNGWANLSSSAISLHLHCRPHKLIKLISPRIFW